MSLRQLAESDLSFTLEDSVTGFGWPVTLTDPSGGSFNLTGQSHDISQIIDPDTGTAISGREASCVLRMSSITAAGSALPVGEADTNTAPWLVAFNDVNGAPYTFKVMYSDPDRTLGTVTLVLGAWKV
ncbi:hypothetical protein [Shewanella phage SFCi1]|nr:hypothetical protein [Shewanella phage SFCi1]